MSTKLYYHNIDLAKVGQLQNFRIHNVTTAERNALAATLGAGNKGLEVYDTTISRAFIWDGTAFISQEITIAGDVVFKGIITDLTDPANVEPVAGYEYVIGTAGTLSISGITIMPNATVEVGDRVLFISTTEAYVQQRNDVEATETVLGNVRKASQVDVNAGTGEGVVTATTLQGKLDNGKYARTYFASVDLVADVPKTVTHGLDLVDRDAFAINTMLNNSGVSIDIDSVDVNSVTLTSLVDLTGVKVFITGY